MKTQESNADGERIAKVIARSGLCSRREAEVLIEDRRVSVNGTVLESAALDIAPSDTVLVDGKPLPAREPPRLWRYYKPKGLVTTHKDPEGRPTVFDALPQSLPRLISVGRLDFNTEGLLLLTNDGDLARHLELPSTGWTRRYRVRAFGEISEAQLQELAGGVTINKMHYGPIEAELEREQGGNVWISVSIREGKNREVRRIMEHLGLAVNRLIRVSFGPFMLGDLEPSRLEEVKTAVLKDQLGPRLSRQLGVRREIMREDRQLGPSRGKPSYMRHTPATEHRPMRREPETTLKRRRIFEEEGSEAPKVEFVREKVPSRGFRPGSARGAEPAPYLRRKHDEGERHGSESRARRPAERAADQTDGKERRENVERSEGRSMERKPSRLLQTRSGQIRRATPLEPIAERQSFRKDRVTGGRDSAGARPERRSGGASFRGFGRSGGKAQGEGDLEAGTRGEGEARTGRPFKERGSFVRGERDRDGDNSERRPFRASVGAGEEGSRNERWKPRRSEAPREGEAERKPFRQREGAPRDGARASSWKPRRSEAPREGEAERKPFRQREGAPKDGARASSWKPRRSEAPREGEAERKPFRQREGAPRDGTRASSWKPRRSETAREGGAERKPFRSRGRADDKGGQGRSWKPREQGAEGKSFARPHGGARRGEGRPGARSGPPSGRPRPNQEDS